VRAQVPGNCIMSGTTLQITYLFLDQVSIISLILKISNFDLTNLLRYYTSTVVQLRQKYFRTL